MRLAIFWSEMLKEIWYSAVALHEDVDQILSHIFIALVVEGSGETLMPNTSGTADAVDVLLDAPIHRGWQVVVDDMLQTIDIPPTSGDAGRDENWTAASAESSPNETLA